MAKVLVLVFPQGWGMSDAPPPPSPQPSPCWNIRAVIRFPFLSPLMFFCLVLLPFLACHFSANGLSADFVFPKEKRTSPFFFAKREAFFMAVVEQLRAGS